MDHLAIDIGGRESQYCLRSPTGEIKDENKVLTLDLAKLLRRLPKSRVVFETCAESHWLADETIAAGHEVRVIPAMLVKTLGVGSRNIKNDRKDARVISETSCRIDLPSTYVPSTQSRERKTLLSMRAVLVQSRTAMINATRGWMRGVAIRVRTGGTETFPKRVRKAASDSVPPHVEEVLTTIEHLTEKIAKVDRQAEAFAKTDERCRRLMSIPGVGPITAVAFVSTLDTTERFPSAHHVEAYLGLTPGEYASSDKHRRTGITKAGSSRMRWLLVQAAWAAKRTAPRDPMVLWSKEVEKRRGKKVAAVALARKMAGILFALWRDGTLYSPLENRHDATPAEEAA
jgi:transposase